MRSTILVLLKPVVAGESVAYDDPLRGGPDDRAGHAGAEIVGDRKGSQVSGQPDPEPAFSLASDNDVSSMLAD
jgi:hypothetical protein